MGILCKPLQRHGTSCCVPQQALQLVPSMGWHLGVGMQRKPVDTGTAGARECGEFPFIPKARANPSHRLPGPLAKGDALRDGGGQGARERGFVAAQGIIPGGYGCIDSRLQVSQPTQRADDPPTDLLEDLGNVRIAGRHALDKARLAALVGAIEVDALKEDNMKMEIQIEAAAESLEKRHRPWLDLLPLDATFDCLVHVVLCDRGPNNRMDLCRQVL